MRTEQETTRIVRSWLEEGVTALPDRVLDAALDQLPATPQRRSWWPARRFATMQTYAKLAIAAAAVLVVALIGYQFLPRTGGVGGQPTPSPSPTLAPTPGPTAAPFLPGSGPVAAGTYTLDATLGVTIEVPASWDACCGTPGWALVKGEAQPDVSAMLYGSGSEIDDIVVYGDSCRWSSSPTSEPRGAEAIAAALAALPGREGTVPRSITVGGYPGVHVRLTVPDDLETTLQPDGDHNFVDCDGAEYRTWVGRHQQGTSQIDDFYFVDVNGHTVVFDVFSFPESAPSDLAELEAVLASVKID